MSDLAMTPEEIAALREERDRLQAERDAERTRADSEARRAETLHGQVLTSSRQIAESTVAGLTAQEQQAEASVGALTQTIASLRAQRQAKLEEGNFAEEGELNEKIAEAVSQRQRLNDAKIYYAQQRQAAAAAPVDPVDQFFQKNPAFPEADREWVRLNPRYATDQEFNQRVNAAHTKAIEQGIPRRSEEYFRFIADAGYMRAPPRAPAVTPQPRTASPGAGSVEDGESQQEPYSEAAAPVEEPLDQQQPQRPAPRASTAAPPSRRSPTAPPGRRVIAELTAEQADTALRNAELAPPEIQAQGDAAILNWWSELNRSQTATRMREEWANR